MYTILPKLSFKIFLLSSLFCLNCAESTKISTSKGVSKKYQLDEKLASNILSLPTHCLQVEYPNKLGQVLGSASDLQSPKALRPIFYGCFDWHSSVHGYWSMIEILRQYPQLDKEQHIRQLLHQHITPENVAVEIEFFNDPNNLSFERTYGWAWLFKLQQSLYKWDDKDAQYWKETLQPLVNLLVERYQAYLPKLVYPIRAGQHDNSAFSMSLSLDYARSVKDEKFERALIEHGKRLFQADKNCNLAYEPSGYDFLSPCLEEAFFMSKIMNSNEYASWLKSFMPEIYNASFQLEPAIVKDRSDGKLVHLDGLNYSRAACLYGIAQQQGESLYHLKELAQRHLAYSLPNLSAQDDYMGLHWLGTFALYALQHNN